ncbi:hypothetical protein BU25DRAFT_416180 [Macroventuria anomochaeta]|uniref:Uncharacterized protein n=1 Tax=Macroventuria anomochaeta TaxID=301207 RepID=A0ACB6RJ83_9PLEO|nr:uncharacterized protein BU25DRAFT_416180 [Macroventuria anomochaeta]KAF2621402.1 hypothetical protein BU25DRAFT_416180 [Macroventuria anomochaeta]
MQLRSTILGPPQLQVDLRHHARGFGSWGDRVWRCNCAGDSRILRGVKLCDGTETNVRQLAIATLATTFSIAAFSLSGGEKVDKTQPPINAKSKDEESFVKNFVQKAEEKVTGKH